MTEPTEGRDGSPSVAALAVHVNSLRREIEDLATKVGGVVAKQREHTAVLHDLTDLRHQVEQILATLTEDDDAPTTWFWLTMSDQEREEKFAELHDWVETVLRVQYPDYLADDLQQCWPNHPEAWWELTWLYHSWSAVYLSNRPTPRDAANWHDRWLPGVLLRLGQVTKECNRAGRRDPPSARIACVPRQSHSSPTRGGQQRGGPPASDVNLRSAPPE